ncbi:hypothetical protein Bsp3421_000053 (plasmid) [Burkholderia sp. FERM BP-3421]|uniref:hypothetical protein n=1 Tax=Burkholderia sp. FERM BP-3421 TaxID=1494466 RepID=UPI00235F3627|nr:hypothetical protein [Burkholderia sp. FERM BP-3421]WDD90232.1 hypothetical protein Bsp3421_000053 [Burkholderia sp. FERM BP-3421]
MRFDLPFNEGYLSLGQLWKGDFTLQGVGSPAARDLAASIARDHCGIEAKQHKNWIIPCQCGLALFARLDRLRSECPNTTSS